MTQLQSDILLSVCVIGGMTTIILIIVFGGARLLGFILDAYDDYKRNKFYKGYFHHRSYYHRRKE